jgi:hypothetical protein
MGGTGGNSISAGPGNDSIEIRTGIRDQYSCGGGTDTVIADPLDPAPSLLDCPLASFEVAPPPHDTQAPSARVAKGRVKLRRKLSIEAALNEPGTLKLGGRLMIGRRAIAGLGPTSSRPDAPGQVWSHRPELSRRAVTRAERALEAGRNVTLRLTLRSRDHAGNTRSQQVVRPLGSR